MPTDRRHVLARRLISQAQHLVGENEEWVLWLGEIASSLITQFRNKLGKQMPAVIISRGSSDDQTWSCVSRHAVLRTC